MPYANLMRIIYMKGILNETYPVSQRPYFLPADNSPRPNESLSWDGNVHGIDYGNDPPLRSLSTLEILNVDDDFLAKLYGAYSSCNYFSNENIEKRLRHIIEKSSDGLFRYHNRVVIPRLASALIKALLIRYHDNTGHPNYRRLVTSLL